jgi:hypothetical protein
MNGCLSIHNCASLTLIGMVTTVRLNAHIRAFWNPFSPGLSHKALPIRLYKKDPKSQQDVRNHCVYTIEGSMGL